MGMKSEPVVKDLVLVGGGHSHVAVLKSFGMKPMPGVRITLVTRDVHTPYSGMLPGLIAGHYEYDDCHIDLRPLANFARSQLLHAVAEGIDSKEKLVFLKDRPPVKFDILSINIGITPKMALPGAEQHVLPVKPIDSFYARWQSIRERIIQAASAKRSGRATPLNIAVVGGGAGGVEILLAMQYRLSLDLESHGLNPKEDLKFVLFARALLPNHAPRVSSIFRRIFDERGISIVPMAAAEVRANEIVCVDGSVHPFDECIWCTQGQAASWLRTTDLDVDADGFVCVRDTLQSTSGDAIFAAGDIHSSATHPRQKSGVIAVRQGPPLTENLRRALAGEPLKPFQPQKSALALISTGDKYAVASKGFLSWEGGWLWSVKDRIDRSFMAKFNDLPAMETVSTPPPPPPAAGSLASSEAAALMLGSVGMRCGGCGSKVGSGILSRAIRRLNVTKGSEVLIGLDAPDDAAVIRVPPGKVLVQTVDFFRSFLNDPFVFGSIAANHALGDCHAMGAQPLSALAIATVPFGREEKVEEELFQMLAGGVRVLEAAGCSLVGGHTAEGRELSLGFSVSGVADEAELLRKGGMSPGDVLLLTKPLGTGVLMAADVRGRARGRWVDAAVHSMCVCSARAAQLLRESGASAATDVTGFGLLGHALEMARASDVDIDLGLDDLPLLEGALSCVQQGILSTLHPANAQLEPVIQNIEEATSHPRYQLLFDPQTAGGLLASLPAAAAASCIESLRGAGYKSSAIVGRVRRKSGASPGILVLPSVTTQPQGSACTSAHREDEVEM